MPGKHGHLALVVHAYGMVAGGQRKNLVQVVAFHPILQLAGCVASIGALLEHRDHDNLHRDGFWRAEGRGRTQHER